MEKQGSGLIFGRSAVPLRGWLAGHITRTSDLRPVIIMQQTISVIFHYVLDQKPRKIGFPWQDWKSLAKNNKQRELDQD